MKNLRGYFVENELITSILRVWDIELIPRPERPPVREVYKIDVVQRGRRTPGHTTVQ